VTGGAGFLLISTGSWENAKKRLSGFGREFTSLFGPRPALRKPRRADVDSDYGNEFEGSEPIANNRDKKDDVEKN
jgi:stage II sporulation protein P